jgi:hypothetical protein
VPKECLRDPTSHAGILLATDGRRFVADDLRRRARGVSLAFSQATPPKLLLNTLIYNNVLGNSSKEFYEIPEVQQVREEGNQAEPGG